MPHLLIDTGPSGYGWSFWGAAFVCLKLWALSKHAGLRDTGPGLIRGSLGHTAEAHRWVRTFPEHRETYYDPERAMREWAARHPEGGPHLQEMITVFRRYVTHYPELPGRVLGVEMLVEGMLGTRRGQFGLWVSRVNGEPWPAGEEVIPAVWPAGAVLAGQPIQVTKRIDGVLVRPNTRIDIWDHKFVHSVTKHSAERYAVDAQWTIMRIFGQQLYEDRFNGVWVNLIGTGGHHQHQVVPMPPAPHRDALFPEQLWNKAHEIAHWERTHGVGFGVHRWPMAQHELVCVGRYSECHAIDICARGVR